MSDPTTSGCAAAFAIPLLPGKTDTDRRKMRSCWQGDRRAAYEASRKRLGITREAVWIQQLPSGDIAIVHLEAGDLNRALTGITTSEDPFDRWLREHSLEVHGVDLKAGFPAPLSKSSNSTANQRPAGRSASPGTISWGQPTRPLSPLPICA